MKKMLKKAVCILVCAAMLVSTGIFTALAEQNAEGCTCEHSPVIVLPGINHSPTYLYDENDNPVYDANGNHIGGTLLILETENLLKNCLPKLIFSLLATIALQHSVFMEDVAYEAASSAFVYQRCDNNGNHVENLKTREFGSFATFSEDDLDWAYRMVPMKPLVDVIGEDHAYFFTFNLVGDPMESAQILDEYIQTVKEETGHDKVTLLPVSLGGTILTAYLEQFGHDDIDQIVNAVACLDGTDILADFMAREWNLEDEYFYHEFIANIFVESNDYGTIGYLINLVLHILPRSGVDAILTGAMSGILDTLVLNCPQFWAMIPSYRYDALSARYLSDPAKAQLKAKTDAFQQARLNLKDNILVAVADGVKVDFISGSNLNFGEQMYTYFGIVASADKVNTDGIINLSSTTLGATGAPNGQTLPEGYTQAYTNPEYPDYSYISPDGRIDASTAILPDNTWIFLDQHHEVGNNDIVLNLAKAIILGEVEDVHSDPEKYPQYNYACNTKYVRRWRLADAYEVDQSTLTEEQKAQLNAAIALGEAAINATIADQELVDEADAALMQVLHDIGYPGYENIEEEDPAMDIFFEDVFRTLSWGALKLLGGGSLVDRILFRS